MTMPDHHPWPAAGGTTPRPAYPSGYAPQHGGGNPTGRPMLRRWLIVGLATIGFAAIALAVAGYFGAAFGVRAALLALICAVIPLGIVVPTFLWLDRFEAEPTRYLVFAFLWGSLVAAGAAAILNTGAVLAIDTATPGGDQEALMTTAVLVAPPVEEAFKGLLVLLIWRLRRREFDGIIDGMVYAGIVAAGFAFTENIQYFGQAIASGEGETLAGVFVGRGLMSPFAHPLFTIMTGIGIGIAATARSGLARFVAPLTGYVLAVLAHALWNLAAVSGGMGLLAVYLAVEVPIFIAFVAFIVWARQREGRLIGTHLSPYADAGWLSPGEVAMLSSMQRRREARIWARTNRGPKGLAAMRVFQDSASELAFLRLRMYHTSADAHALETERRLLDALVTQRRELLGAY